MPYKLRKAPKSKWGDDAYWVINKETGEHKSKDPLPKERAKAQMRALYAAEGRQMKGAGVEAVEGATALADAILTDMRERKGEGKPRADVITMKPADFFKEHKSIVKMLSKTANTLKAEAQDQAKEAKGWARRLKGKGAEGAVPTFAEWAEAKGHDIRDVDTSNRASDKLAFDEAKFKELMKGATSRERYEARRAKVPSLKPYEEYLKDYEAVQRSRATSNPAQERRKTAAIADLKERNRLYAQYLKEFPEAEEVMCNVTADAERGAPERVSAGECKARHTAYNKKQYEKDPFGKIVTGLTKIADTAVEMLPLGKQTIGTVYKAFAPPTSKFSSGGARGRPKKTAGRERVLRRFDLPLDGEHSLHDIAEHTGVPMEVLHEVYGRGVKGRRARKADHAWLRIYSLLDGRAHKDDADLHAKLEGSGFFSDLWSKGKKIVTGAVQRVKDVFRGVRKDEYPPNVREMLARIGNIPVEAISVRRDPIQSMLHKALNLVTLGSWDRVRKQHAYDTLYHIGIEITLTENGAQRRYVLEKNAVINLAPANAYTKDTETIPCPLPSDRRLTISEMLQKTKERMGETKFFTYDAFENNCSIFIENVLKANNLYSPEIGAFIEEPLDKVLAGLPNYTQRVARFATDAGGIVDVALKGRGLDRPRAKFAKQLAETNLSPRQYLTAVRKAAKAHGYDPKCVMFADDDVHKIAVRRDDGSYATAGRVGYGDFILWSALEKQKKVPAGFASKKRNTFQKSHSKIKGDWKSDKYSPNNLALKLLW